MSLTTENPANVPLCRHFGYEVLGEADVSGAFTSWVMFRPDRGPQALSPLRPTPPD